MKIFFTLFIICGGFLQSFAQITGTVYDSKNEPVAFAFTAIFNSNDTLNAVSTGVTNEKGEFTLQTKDVKTNFSLVITSFGFETLKLKNIHWNGNNLSMGELILKPTGNDLETYEFKEEKDVVQLGIDKRVFNVEKQAVATGGSALDVLAGVPGISIDNDGGISIRGSSNITILINGKPSALLGSGRKGALDKIPASQVQSVEIISNPSAKYDPDGTGGIINIVLKKNKETGTNGRIALNAGTNFNHGISTQINHKKDNVLLNASYDYRYEDLVMVSRVFRTFYLQDSSYSSRLIRGGSSWNYSHVARIGVDWEPNKKNNLGFTANFLTNPRYRDMTLNFFQFNSQNDLTHRYRRIDYEKEIRYTWDANIFYIHKFNDKGHELYLSSAYSGSFEKDSSQITQDTLDHLGNTLIENSLVQKNILPERFYLITNQADYTLPVPKINGKLEAGLKAIMRSIDNDNRVFAYDSSLDTYNNDVRYSNRFVFTESIFSAYSQLAGKHKKLGYQGGIRLEQALTESEQMVTDEKYPNNYFSVFPSLFLTYDLKEGSTLNASYSRRINRPSEEMLNPFIDIGDLTTQRVGNPFLNPEYVNSSELGYSYFKDKLGISLVGFYRETNNAFQRVATVIGDNIVRVRFENIARNQSYGIEANTNIKLLKWWKLNVSGSWFYFKTSGENLDASLVNNAAAWTTKVISNITFWKNADFQLNFNYKSNSVTVQGTFIGVPTLDLALRKPFLDDRLSIAVRLSDAMDTQRFNYILDTETLKGDVLWDRQSRIFMAEIVWNFGQKISGKPSKKPDSGSGRPGGGGED